MSTNVVTPNVSQPKGEWLRLRLDTLYKSDRYTKGNQDTKNFYKRKAYDKWVVPFYQKTYNQKPPFSQEEFLSNEKFQKRLQSEQFWERSRIQDQKNFFSALRSTDKSLAGISSYVAAITAPTQDHIEYRPKPGALHNTPRFHAVESEPYLVKGSPDTSIHKAAVTSEKYWDEQAQDMEDRIQSLGGHNFATRVSGLIADAGMFEATGASKASSIFRIANPRTLDYTERLLRAEWNGAVTGFFWGASTGTKPQDIHEDISTFALFGVAGATGTQALKFLTSFSKVAPLQVVQSTVNKAVESLLKDGIEVPKQSTFNPSNIQQNEQMATAGVAKVLNTIAYGVEHQSPVGELARPTIAPPTELKGSDLNGAFKRLTPSQQKLVVTRLFGALSTYQQKGQQELTKQVGVEFLKEEEQKAIEANPMAKQVQQEVNQFIQERIPGQDPTQSKIGAILPHHNTSIDSPIHHISGRMSWLRQQLRKEGLSSEDRKVLQQSLDDEKKIYSKVKEMKQKSTSHGTKGVSQEELSRQGKNYVVSNTGQVTYHGKQFDPGSTSSGSTHVTVLPSGEIRVNQGQQLTPLQQKKLQQALESN